MPRKTAKKDTATAESKSEVGTTRRSGRSVTKQEPSAGKEASRSRRGSTAAQTAASVADSKTPKGRSSSPSEGRKSRRESSEPRPKTAPRRAASRVNYKESDGEEEVVAPKFDEETFDSNEEFEDSESDEKSKPKAKGRAVKTPPKARGAKGKGKSPRSRRGRPMKKQSSDEEEDEDMEPIELSEDSVEVDEVTPKKTKEPARSSRGRKTKADESEVKTVEKPKSSRRSARAPIVREESTRKRPTRGVQAKKYTEDDEDIEEIDDTQEDDAKPQEEGGRKRKRSSVSESNKRLKEDESAEKEKEADVVDDEEDAEKSSEAKPEGDSEDEKEKSESKDEPMEVDESDGGGDKDESGESSAKTEKEVEVKTESPAAKEKEGKGDEKAESSELSSSKEKLGSSKKQESVDSSENLDESMQSFDSDQGSRAEQSVSSGLEDSQDAKETKPVEKTPVKDSGIEKTKSQVEHEADSSDSFEDLGDSPEPESLNETGKSKEQKQTVQEKAETNANLSENVPSENKPAETEKKPVVPLSSPAVITHSKDANAEALNGSEKPVSNTAPVIHSASAVKLQPEDSAPTANGAHDLHNNSVSESNQYYPFPGRKFVINAKLGENIRQSVKDKSFGFVSYNLGLSSSDSSIQKEKLLNELNKLDAHIICIQQVSKLFYAGILEPSLDALGFKGTFSQPEENEKGIATFYKSSLFRLSGQSEASLKHLIEKELEVSSLEPNDRLAVKTHVKKCGHILFTHFATVIGMHSLTVANVQVPPTDLSIHALQVSCLAREVVRINGGSSKPFLLGGEFNMVESEAPYQLLRDGYLSNDMIEELQRRKDVALPGKENAALVNLLWKSFQHPSSTLCSCYKSVLDHEVTIPEQKTTSPDLLWYSSDSLYTTGVLDASGTAAADRHFSLKADIAFSM